MTSAHLQQWITHPEILDRDTLYELRTMVARYPYFQSLRLLYLKNLYLLHDAAFGVELRKAVLYVADRRVLFHLIEGDRYKLQAPKPFDDAKAEWKEEPGVDRTLFLINAFLASVPEEQAESAQQGYSMDYTACLLSENNGTDGDTPREEAPSLCGQDLIDDFLASSQSQRMAGSDSDGEEPNDARGKEELDRGCFTETLAKIYIRQHRYEKALEIIKKLSLNNSNKNVYFADQIRFLEKLIINAKSK